jgi:glycerol-3-phosphate acyltransferase PlsX
MDLAAVTAQFEPRGQHRVRVAVDAMGGDHGPAEVVPGTLDWARANPDVEVILVGEEARVAPHVGGPLPERVTLMPATELVDMDEVPAAAVRRKRDASINVAMRLVREGRADAVVTAGHTGAGVAAAILGLGRLRGVDRPALAVQMVSDKGPFVFLDIGATTDSTGLNLYQYARMGSIFAERVLGVREPTVGLLSIGEEGGKGEARVQEATARLQASDLGFIGNVEGKDLVSHLADVVVCDASVGNVTIKFFEGLSGFIFEELRREFRRPPWGPLGFFFMRPGIARIRSRFDYEKLGGSPLLGVKGTVVITHGRARRRMIGYAVGVGAAAARVRVPELIAEALAADAERERARGVAAAVGELESQPPLEAAGASAATRGVTGETDSEAADAIASDARAGG